MHPAPAKTEEAAVILREEVGVVGAVEKCGIALDGKWAEQGEAVREAPEGARSPPVGPRAEKLSPNSHTESRDSDWSEDLRREEGRLRLSSEESRDLVRRVPGGARDLGRVATSFASQLNTSYIEVDNRMSAIIQRTPQYSIQQCKLILRLL